MYIVEIFKKRRHFEPIFKKLWERIISQLVYPQSAREDQQRKLVYVGMIAYAAVFSSAMAAGMSSSAAHYLARTQMRQYKFDKPTAKAVERVFSGTDKTDEKAFATLLTQTMSTIIDMKTADDREIGEIMQELAQNYVEPSLWAPV